MRTKNLAPTKRLVSATSSVERLEPRIAPALTSTMVGATVTMVGDGADDVLEMTIEGVNLKHTLFSRGIPGFESDLDFDSTVAGVQTLASDGLSSITASLGAGNDIAIGVGPTVLVFDGQEGDDFLNGGSSGDVLMGGPGQDTLIGRQGIDALFGDDGADLFVWGPGDSNDSIFGGGGVDTFTFNGSAASENITLSANGTAFRIFRDVAAVTIDAVDLEQFQLNTLAGADIVTVNDLSATPLRVIRLGLAGSTGAADGQTDNVILNGSGADEEVRISADGDRIRVLGLPTLVEIAGTNTGDNLSVNAGLGMDNVFASSAAQRLMTVNIVAETSVDRALASVLSAATGYDVGKGPGAMVTGNLLGSGADVVIVNRKSNTISILFNTGEGNFLPAVQMPTGGKGAHSAAIGDFDRDGLVDIAVTNSASGTVGILFNNGNGTFAQPVTIAVGKKPGMVRTGDLDQDGNLDLVIVTAGNSVTRLLGGATGEFTDLLKISTGGKTPVDLLVADFTNDGRADLAIAHAGSNNVTLLTMDVTNTFLPPVATRVGIKPTSLVAADFNGDGKLDLAVSHAVSRFVSVLMNASPAPQIGAFLPQVKLVHPGKRVATGIAVADLDNDSRPDLLIACSGSGSAAVFFGAGSAIFRAPLNIDLDNTPPRKSSAIAVADFNSDGFVDFAVANSATNDVNVIYGLRA
jgi:hypothetical protein